MDLEHTHLHERDQPLDIPDEQIGAGVLESIDIHFADPRRDARAGVALEKAFPLPALGAAYQADRPPSQMRKHVIGDAAIIIGKRALGYALLGIKNLVGAGEADTLKRDLVAFSCCHVSAPEAPR